MWSLWDHKILIGAEGDCTLAICRLNRIRHHLGQFFHLIHSLHLPILQKLASMMVHKSVTNGHTSALHIVQPNNQT